MGLPGAYRGNGSTPDQNVCAQTAGALWGGTPDCSDVAHHSGRQPDATMQRSRPGGPLRRQSLAGIFRKKRRHRLNHGGNRQANNALWTIAMVRMRGDARTREYVARRTGEVLSKKGDLQVPQALHCS